jgi:hypothetical protein
VVPSNFANISRHYAWHACQLISSKLRFFSFCKTTFFKPSSFELCYIGLVFVIDKNVVVVGNTNGVQLGGLITRNHVVYN